MTKPLSTSAKEAPWPDASGQYPLFGKQVSKPKPEAEPMVPDKEYSHFVVYVDESGDHGLDDLALGFCLEALYEFMREKHQDELPTHVVVECRGKKEDAELELEFRRVCAGENKFGKPLPFEAVFADKKTNSTGLQLADPVARPIGSSVVRPAQANRAFDVLKQKFFCSGGRKHTGVGFEGWGLKIHPAPESERPR